MKLNASKQNLVFFAQKKSSGALAINIVANKSSSFRSLILGVLSTQLRPHELVL